MLGSLKKLLSPAPVKQQSFEAYVQIVAQARKAVFYKEWKVEDTLDGRFDAIVLHLFLVISRLEEEGNRIEMQPKMHDFIRNLSEAFFSDMDRSLREMGASDTGVGIRVKKMAQAFYGRLKAYKEAIGDERLMAEALGRNVYRERPIPREAIEGLAAYMERNHNSLLLQSVDNIMQGAISFSS